MITPERFMAKVVKVDAGCWEWQAYRNEKGYGRCRINRKYWLAHRAAWVIFKGKIPGDLHVLHRCDNPCCVNPDHLFLGTHLENMADRSQKGRVPNGEKHGRVKLTTEIVRQIRTSLSSMRAEAKRYGVGLTTIWDIRHNVTWKGA